MRPVAVRRKSNFARRLILLGAAIPAGVALFVDAPVPAATRALITVLWILSLIPLYMYFGTPPEKRRPLPFFPAISTMYGLYYALPLTLGIADRYYNAQVDPRLDYDFPVQLAFFGWILMVAGYLIASVLMHEKPLTREMTWSPRSLARWGLALLYGGVLVGVARAYFGFVMTSGGIYQFVVSLEWLGAGLLTVLARRGELPLPMKTAAIAGIVFTAAMMLASGSIAPVAMFLGVLGFGFWIGKPSIQMRWVVVAIAFLLAAMSFRGIAIDFRQTAWFGSQRLSQSERLGLMVRLLQVRVRNTGVIGTVANGITETAGRSADMDLFANVVRRTPSEIPYWNGATYLSLVGSFVPRFLWPNKPTKELGQAFGHRYNLIYWTNASTAINLPILVEFFANFSTLGLVVGMFLVGIIYRIVDAAANRAGQTPVLSMIGGVLLLPLLLIESDFSLVFGGIPLNAAALWLVWRILSRKPSHSKLGASAPRGLRLRGPHTPVALPTTGQPRARMLPR